MGEIFIPESIVVDVGHRPCTYEKTGTKGTILNGEKIEEYDLNRLVAVDFYNIMVSQKVKVNYSLPLDKPLGNLTVGEELYERTDYINKIKPDLVVSFHHDANKNKNVSGFTIYTYPGTKLTHEDLKPRITKKMKNICKENGLNKDIYSRSQKFHMLDKIKYSYGILIECGFFTNPQDVLITRKFHFQIALFIAEAILNKKICIVNEPQNWEEILEGCLDYPDTMIKNIKSQDNIKYLPEMVKKVFNYGKKFKI